MIAALDAAEAKTDLGQAMKCFSPSQLPVLTELAREFVVCDHWFCSMPGPTEPNRMFAHAGTAGTWDRSPDASEIFWSQGPDSIHDGIKFKHGTVYKLLRKAGVKYRIYACDSFPVVGELDDVGEQREFEDFARDLQDPSFDAGYIHIEPSYDALDDFEDGNSQHPNGSVAAGERFIKATYEAIRNSPVWEKSLLIITWDEHGGFYDHVIPGPAVPTGNRGRTHGFMFDQLGPRVPALVVSPLIPRNLIEHKTFDHTAIPATLSRVFKLPALGTRDGISGGVDHLVGLKFRPDTPTTLLANAGVTAIAARPVAKTAARRPDALLSDDPSGTVTALLHSALVQHLKASPAEEHAAIVDRVRSLRTRADAFTYLKEVEQLTHDARVKAGLARTAAAQ
jgi:phospholipase C